MTGDLPLSDTFGNYLIRGIAEIQPPAPVPWTPSAPGWILLWGILLLAGIWMVTRLFLRWKQNAYRRQALRLLEKIEQQNLLGDRTALCALPRLLKNTALKAYPRSRVASLSGEKWIAFLECRCPDPGFRSDAGRHLVAVSYEDPDTWSFTQEETDPIFSLAGRWIRTHRREGPP